MLSNESHLGTGMPKISITFHFAELSWKFFEVVAERPPPLLQPSYLGSSARQNTAASGNLQKLQITWYDVSQWAKNEKCESKMILWNNEFPPIICIFELPTTIVMGQVQKRQAISMPSFECQTSPGPSFKPLSRAQTLMIFMFLLNM